MKLQCALNQRLTQDVPPTLDWHVDERVKDSQGHERNDASDDDPEPEVDVDNVGFVEPHGCRRDPKFHSHLLDKNGKVNQGRDLRYI